jgi:pyruvate/2-oxoglutarate dehydrogenase complex dihydrolipoamide acyltransferase (E2) component
LPEIRIPKLGVTMTEGTLQQWLVDDGATVGVGQPLYILETDKVETEIESPASGVVRLLGIQGSTYDVAELIAEIS